VISSAFSWAVSTRRPPRRQTNAVTSLRKELSDSESQQQPARIISLPQTG
jgi:hypothetical protein